MSRANLRKKHPLSPPSVPKKEAQQLQPISCSVGLVFLKDCSGEPFCLICFYLSENFKINKYSLSFWKFQNTVTWGIWQIKQHNIFQSDKYHKANKEGPCLSHGMKQGRNKSFKLEKHWCENLCKAAGGLRGEKRERRALSPCYFTDFLIYSFIYFHN